MKYIIYSPGYRENSGGIVVLHNLGKKLQEKGHTVFMLSPNTLKGLQTINAQQAAEIKDDCWVIYPEIVNGNPLQASNVVRWVLNTPGYIGGNSNTWSENDLVFLLWDYFELDPKISIEGYLRVWDFKLEYFTEGSPKNRTLNTYMIRKASGKKGSPKEFTFDKHPEDALQIDGEIANNFSKLRETFHKSKLFISYDPVTYYSVIAALCGVTSIIIPDNKTTKEQLIEKLPIYKYGIGYGIDDTEWAESTKHKVRGHLLELEDESDKMLTQFIQSTKDNFRYRFPNFKLT